MDEGAVSSSEEKNGEESEGEPRRIGLKGSGPGQFALTVDALFLAAVDESEVDDADTHPVDQRCNRDKVLEPSEDSAGSIG